MACSICKKAGHDRRKCPVRKKENAAQVELQLSERRFILEAIDSTAALLQVPMVTAGVWYMLSRSNTTLGILNKAILTAELTPIIGDIKFPEGVLLGAAMESTEDMVNILSDGGVMEKYEDVKKDVKEAAEKVVSPIADVIIPFITPEAIKKKSCEDLAKRVWTLHLLATGRKESPEGVIDDPETNVAIQVTATQAFYINIKAMKDKGCERPKSPYYSPPEQWNRL